MDLACQALAILFIATPLLLSWVLVALLIKVFRAFFRMTQSLIMPTHVRHQPREYDIVYLEDYHEQLSDRQIGAVARNHGQQQRGIGHVPELEEQAATIVVRIVAEQGRSQDRAISTRRTPTRWRLGRR